MIKRLLGKRALITGATKGLGRAIAKRYAQEGAHLILVGRDIKALEELDDQLSLYNVEVTLVPFDLKQFSAINHLAQQVWERYGKLDILVGNAGVLGELMPIAQMQPDVWNDVLYTNLNANWHLIRAFDLLLQKSTEGRAIFVTSNVTEAITPYWSAYAVSKSALETCVLTYASEITNSSLKVNLVDPGVMRTSMRSKAMPGEDPKTQPLPEDKTDVFVFAASGECTECGTILRAHDFIEKKAV